MTPRRLLMDRAMRLAKPRVVTEFAPPPVPIAPDVWSLDRRLRMTAGTLLPNRTTIMRLKSGGLLFVSPPPVAPGLGHLDALGAVEEVLLPNSFHYLYGAEFLTRYPFATLRMAPGLHARIPGLPAGDELTDATPAPWQGVIEHAILETDRGLSEVALIPSSERHAGPHRRRVPHGALRPATRSGILEAVRRARWLRPEPHREDVSSPGPGGTLPRTGAGLALPPGPGRPRRAPRAGRRRDLRARLPQSRAPRHDRHAGGAYARRLARHPIRRFVHRLPLLLERAGLPVPTGLFTVDWIVLETVGRRSGRPHVVVLDVIARDHDPDRFYVQPANGVASDWVRNVRHEPR